MDDLTPDQIAARAAMKNAIPVTLTTAGRSVLREWTFSLPFRHQGVLLAAIRGCDGVGKHNNAKPIVRALRHAIMHPADEREVNRPGSFMSSILLWDEVTVFLRYWDHYPIHYIQHLMHACQVVGVCHPLGSVRSDFYSVYLRIVHKLHLEPESRETMHRRLTEDRIALYGNATGDM